MRLLVLSIWLTAAGCRATAGVSCTEQTDCQTGLTCRVPAVDGGRASSGVCLPALQGTGEVCLQSADCEAGLRCSSEIGEFQGDNLHGLCQALPDAASPADGHPSDGGAADAVAGG